MIILILISGLVLRLILLNQSFWLDEAISALTAFKQFPYQWNGITGDFQPPFYYILLHFYMALGIRSEWFLRIPSVIFGVITIFIIYLFAKDLFNKRVALVSSLLLAISQFHIYYSQELRMYSLLCLLATAVMWLFYKRRWVWLVIMTILGFYTNYMFFLLLIPQFLWVLYLLSRNKKILKEWMLSLVISVLFFMPWFPNFLKQLSYGRNLVTSIPQWQDISSLPFWKLLPQVFLKFTLGRISFDNKILYGAVFAGLIILFGYILSSLKSKINDKTLFVLNWFTGPLLGSVLMSFFVPVSGVWRLIFLLPPFLILVGISLGNMRNWKSIFLLILALNLISNILYWTFPKYQRENWRKAAEYIDTTDNPVVFTVNNGFAPYNWYTTKQKLVCGPLTINNCLNSINVYYVSYLKDLFDKNNRAQENIIGNGYKQTEVKDFSGVGPVFYYSR